MSTDSKGHVPGAVDKWLLVRYKKFASKQDIPQTVRYAEIYFIPNTIFKKDIQKSEPEFTKYSCIFPSH